MARKASYPPRPQSSSRASATSAASRRKTASPLAGVHPPRPGEGKRGEHGYFGYLLRQAAAASRLTLERALAELGATPPQFVVLTMLRAYPGVSGADLARLSLLTPQTVSVIVANLERAGWIARAPHASHGRIVQIEITGEGAALLARCKERVAVVEKWLASGLSESDALVVRRWLAGLAKED